MQFSPMAAAEKTVLSVSGDEGGDFTGTLSNGHQIGDQRIPINCFSNGQGLNMGIINQYGQLMGEFSRLDDELWFSKPDDNKAMEASNGGFQCDLLSAYKHNADLHKLSNFVYNSVCDGGWAVAKESSSSLKDSSLDRSQTSSPFSVLQNRRSYFNVRTSVIKRARSKRHRPSKCKPYFEKQNNSFLFESYMDSPLLDEIAEPIVRTKKVNDLLQSGSEGDLNLDPKPTPKRKLSQKFVKKCSHCESTRTPQWREGPLGRATLCNACGVQFRNGRLFHEYRPLISPNFDPSLHSNLPKKVQQMRMSKNC